MPDIIYVVRSGERNTPLRFSLRSLANIPHRRVIVAGYCPTWVRNVERVPVRRTTNKFDSIEKNLRAAIAIDDLTDRVIYFNDDFFVMQPIDEMPVLNGGPSRSYSPRDEMRWRYKKTLRLLGDSSDLLRYDGTHVPLPLVVDEIRSVFDRMPPGILWRTWYGNVAHLGGETTHDVKSRDGSVIDGPFMSCAPKAIHALKHYLEDVLPRGGPYV